MCLIRSSAFKKDGRSRKTRNGKRGVEKHFKTVYGRGSGRLIPNRNQRL